MIAAYPKQMCTAVVPVTPSSARLRACESVCAGRVRAGLHVRLVQLDDVRPSVEQVPDLLVAGVCVGESERGRVVVVVVLRLLRHRERSGHGHFDLPPGMRAQELDVADLDRARPTDLTGHPWHRVRMTAAVKCLTRMVDVDPGERGREVVGVALPADLAVGDDVQAGVLLRPDGQQGAVVLGLRQVLGEGSPQLECPNAWREAAGQLRPIDQPLGLRVAPDQTRREQWENGPSGQWASFSEPKSRTMISTRCECQGCPPRPPPHTLDCALRGVLTLVE